MEVARLQDELVEAEESNQEAGMTPQEERDKLLKDAIAKFEDRKERQLYIDGVLDMYNAIMSMFHLLNN